MPFSKKNLKADIVIIGAGVAGLSTAYHLALHSNKSILILEQEAALGGHASGRNAGMIRQTVSDSSLARLAVLGRKALAKASKDGWKFDFVANGSLLLAKKNNLKEIKQIAKTTRKLGVLTQRLSPAEAALKVPLLEGAHFEEALFCPGDALVETRPLLESFYRQLKRRNVRIHFSQTPQRITKLGNAFYIHLPGKQIVAKKVVNAAGAWCAQLAQNIGAQKIPLRPYRRHLYVTDSFGMKHENWPFVWDLTHNFYFRPEGNNLLFSPCDKVAVDRKFLDERKEKVDGQVKKLLLKKLKSFSKKMGRLKIKTQKSGLRTLVPDGRFVIGEDTRLKDFYWVAGLGGHGVTTCFSVGKLSSDIILGRRADLSLAKAFSPSRFKS